MLLELRFRVKKKKKQDSESGDAGLEAGDTSTYL